MTDTAQAGVTTTIAPARSALPASPPRRFTARFRYRGDHLLRTGHLLTLSSMATSAVGLLYWAAASRYYGAAAVGESYAAVSAMTFLAAIGQLNLDSVLIRFLPGAGVRSRRLVSVAYLASTLGALAAATVFVFLVPHISSGLDFLHTPGTGAAFVLGAGAYALFAVQDGALTGLRRPGWILIENACFAVLKIALVLVLARTALHAQGILMSWVASLFAAVAVTNGFLFGRLSRVVRESRAAASRAGVADPAERATLPNPGYIAADYIGQMIWMATTTLPPIIVLDRLDATQGAYYSLAFVMTHALFMVSINMGLSLVVESARDPAQIEGFRRMLRHTGLLLTAGTGVLVAAAPLIMRVFGPGYVAGGTGPLRLSALSALPNLVIVTAVSIARAEQRLGFLLGIYASAGVLVLVLTEVLLSRYGLDGAAMAWPLGLGVPAVVLLGWRRLWVPRVAYAQSPPRPWAGPGGTAPGPALPAWVPGPQLSLSLSVIVCAYTMDRWDDLCAAIESLRRQERRPDEIILVVDHCEELAGHAEFEFDDVLVLRNAEQRGLSGARNTGVQAASGDVIAFLDDDAAAERSWTVHLLEAYGEDPDVLGAGGLVEPNWQWRRPPWFPREFDWVVGCSYLGLPTETAPVRNFIGANMSFRREVFISGGFRHDLGRIGTRPLGGEETELCIRAVREHPGGRLVYEPAASVRHNVTPGRATWAYFRARCYAEGLSKAAVSRHAGADAALASERAYVTRTIPAGLVRPLRPGPDRTHPATALALLVGVLWTTAGYGVGRLNAALARLRSIVLPAEPLVSERSQAAAFFGAVALPVALVLWIRALHGIRLARISDLGLITAVPWQFWGALALLTVGFAAVVASRARINAALPAGYVLTLIAVLHATPAIVYPTLRYSWAWKHVAIVDFMTAHGAVATGVPQGNAMAAYSQWPGFFALNSLLVQLTGAPSAGSFAAWGPPVFNALMLVPLLLLYRAFSGRRRLIWTAIWVFYISSWVGQDYFSPQAFSYVLCFLVLALVIRRMQEADAEGRAVRIARPELALILVIMAAISSSHQLTPVMMVVAAAALMVRKRHRRALLPLLAGLLVLTAGWDFTVAWPFLSANLRSMIATIGSLDANAGSGLISLSSVGRDQVLIAWADRALSATLYLLGAIALVRRPQLRRSALPWLATAPAALAVLSSYGGEMVFRVYLFALPALALLAATLLLPRLRYTDAQLLAAEESGIELQDRRAKWAAGLVRRLCLPLAFGLLFTGFVFAYYGKEKANYFTPGEVAAAQFLHSRIRPGQVILAANDNFPDAYLNYPAYTQVWFAEQDAQTARAVTTDPIGELTVLAEGSAGQTAYVILNSAQAAEVAQTGSLPAGGYARILAALGSSPFSALVFHNADASVFEFTVDPADVSAAAAGSEPSP